MLSTSQSAAMTVLLSNPIQLRLTTGIARVSFQRAIENSTAVALALRFAIWSFRSRQTTAESGRLKPSSCRQFAAAVFCLCAPFFFDSRLYSGTGSGHIRRPAALGLLLREAPCGYRFLPKQILSKNGTERRANFFRFPPRKQTFGTWEPGPLPRLRHVCPESIREFKTEKRTCI
jgi:hypothetical protein